MSILLLYRFDILHLILPNENCYNVITVQDYWSNDNLADTPRPSVCHDQLRLELAGPPRAYGSKTLSPKRRRRCLATLSA